MKETTYNDLSVIVRIKRGMPHRRAWLEEIQATEGGGEGKEGLAWATIRDGSFGEEESSFLPWEATIRRSEEAAP